MHRRYTMLWGSLVTALLVYQFDIGRGEDGSCVGITRGRHFVLTFTGNHLSNPSVTELSLIVVAFGDGSTTGTITSKHLIDGEPYKTTFQIDGKKSVRVQIPVELLLGFNSEHSNKVVAVDTDNDVSAYGLNYAPFTTDAFLAIPVNNLGFSHMAMSYENDGNNDLSSLFAVVGVEDATLVSVVLTAGVTYEGVSYQRGESLELSINKGEVIQLVADSPVEYIGGSSIESSRPIAVFAGHLCASTPSSACDTLSEQIVPVESWGTKYIYTPTGSQFDKSVYTIHAYYSNTIINVPGIGEINLQIGEHWQGELIGSGVITSNNPVSVLQLLRTINQRVVDPSIIQVPSEDQFSYIFGFSTPYKSGGDDQGFFNFINIIIKTEESETITMNGEHVLTNSSSIHHSIPQTDYEVYTLQLSKGEGTYYIEQTSISNTSAFGVIVYGYEHAETYGYSAGLSLPSDERLLTIEPYFVREIGGELLTVTLPCLGLANIQSGKVQCKFTTDAGNSQAMTGKVIDIYNIVCTTPVFHEISYVTVDVSVDGGETFPFTGNIHVLPQHVLPSRVVVEQSEQPLGYINFASNQLIYLQWNSKDFFGVEYVRISFRSAIPAVGGDQGFIWSTDLHTFSDVENLGTFSFVPSDIPSDSIAPFKTTIIQFIITPHREPALNYLHSAFLKVIESTLCREWPNRLHDFSPDSLNDVTPCPCTEDQALVDGNFRQDDISDLSFVHYGAVSCFRASIGSGSAGQECCYGTDGNIIVGPPGGGTADAYAVGNALNFGTIWHLWYDVLPWFSCCQQTTDCADYYNYRPSDDCAMYEPPRPTRGTGDPHFLSLDGKEFTFNGAGEFLLLRSSVSNLTLQARMEALPDTAASVYTAFVISSSLSSTIQVQRSNLNETVMILVDGVPIDLYYDGFLIREQTFRGMRIDLSLDLSRVRIRLKSGVTLSVRITPQMMSFILQLPGEYKQQTEGLLGNFNENPDDDLMTPDGSILPPNATLNSVHYDFGLSWMVDVNTSIFTYLPPFDFYSFRNLEFAPSLEFPDVDDVSDEVKSVCGNSSICMFDAVTTGSTAFANDSLQDVQEFQTITEQSVKIVSCGYPGEVENGYVNGSVYLVGSSIVVICNDISYLSNGDGILHCQPDGTWSQSIPKCILITCPSPDIIENGVITGDDDYAVGSSVHISCNDGFVLSGQSNLTCDVNGTWSDNLPKCNPAPSDGISPGILSLIVILSCLLLGAIVIGIVFLVRNSKTKPPPSKYDDNKQMSMNDPDKNMSYSQYVQQ